MIYLEAFSKVLPVILLFILGAFLRRTRFVSESTVGDLKKLIVNITLPAVLEAAVMTMFVLPPPFVIPLFMAEPEGADRTFVVNTLSLATLVTLVAFTVITVVYRP